MQKWVGSSESQSETSRRSRRCVEVRGRPGRGWKGLGRPGRGWEGCGRGGKTWKSNGTLQSR